MMALGEIVREYRMQRGLTQSELARLCGFSAAFICNIEKNKYKFTSTDSIYRLAKALRVKTSMLYGHLLINGTNDMKGVKPKSMKDFTIHELQTNIIEIPVLQELREGSVIMDYIYIKRPKRGEINLVGIQTKGYSLPPSILDGDILIVDKAAKVNANDTVLYYNSHQQPVLAKFTKKLDLTKCSSYGVVVGIYRKLQ